MSATLTTPHTFELPYTADDLDEVGGSEAQYQAVLDAEAAELRAEVEAIDFRPRKLAAPAETGTPEEIDAYLEQVAEELAKLPELAEVFARAMPRDSRTGERLFTAADVLAWIERAVEHGCTIPRLRAQEVEDVFRLKRVPNALLREEYLRQADEHEDDGLLTRLAVGIDAVSPGDRPDTTYVQRLLGVLTSPGSRGYAPTMRFFMDYEQAVGMADQLDLDFHDLGI